MTEQRPELNNKISPKDFQDFYWLKEELISFCKEHGIDCSDGKNEITSRIIHFLETGQKPGKPKEVSPKPESKFDWKKEMLTLETIITDSYRNTENARLFFIKEIGEHFKFNVLFMNWMKQNTGKRLKDAVEEWNRIRLLKKDKSCKPEIDSQFEYNMYIRDFLKDNPDLSLNDARKYWMLKKQMRGCKKYDKTDLQLKTDNLNMSSSKTEILSNICYTELVYERINKKLNGNFSRSEIEKMLFDIIRETQDIFFRKIGKNIYVTNSEKNIKVTVNSNTYRVITVDAVCKNQ